ncbi:MAG: hypothetical protein LBT46_02815 [Planctomycetaceae bacterium]|jgi:hypothetical protein|nr:hypothetical protein [Planctomycetaceae bacterium]
MFDHTAQPVDNAPKSIIEEINRKGKRLLQDDDTTDRPSRLTILAVDAPLDSDAVLLTEWTAAVMPLLPKGYRIQEVARQDIPSEFDFEKYRVATTVSVDFRAELKETER